VVNAAVDGYEFLMVIIRVARQHCPGSYEAADL
jgi:hypothetical protein